MTRSLSGETSVVSHLAIPNTSSLPVTAPSLSSTELAQGLKSAGCLFYAETDPLVNAVGDSTCTAPIVSGVAPTQYPGYYSLEDQHHDLLIPHILQNNDFTISYWLYIPSIITDPPIYPASLALANPQFRFRVVRPSANATAYWNNTWNYNLPPGGLVYFTNALSSYRSLFNIPEFREDRWHHITLSHNSSTLVDRLWVDGKEKVAFVAEKTAGTIAAGSDLLLRRWDQEPGSDPIRMKNFAVLNYSVSTLAQVRTLMAGRVPDARVCTIAATRTDLNNPLTVTGGVTVAKATTISGNLAVSTSLLKGVSDWSLPVAYFYGVVNTTSVAAGGKVVFTVRSSRNISVGTFNELIPSATGYAMAQVYATQDISTTGPFYVYANGARLDASGAPAITGNITQYPAYLNSAITTFHVENTSGAPATPAANQYLIVILHP